MLSSSSHSAGLRRAAFSLVAIAYCLLIILYAVNVPRWNAPDEPAHFNYIRVLVDQAEFPILRVGDYDFGYLERLKAARFPDELSVAAVRYEGHQPPLYYLLAAPLFAASNSFGLNGQVLVLRLFSGLCGLLLLLVAYSIVRRVFPADHWLAIAVPAFMAFTPMFLADNAAIGNDPLANLIVAVIVWECAGILSLPDTDAQRLAPTGRYLRLGLWMGLALLTKTTAYAALGVGGVAMLVAARRKTELRKSLRPIAAACSVTLLISAWWFLRNAFIYGADDPFGLRRHNAVVAGQPTTGTVDLQVVRAFAVTTFQSFWGQFGWMGVPMDERVYLALAVLSLAAALGFALCLLALWRGQCLIAPAQRAVLQLLLLTFLLVAGAMLQYSFGSFFQPQARYLFPAFVPIAFGFVLGIRALAAPRLSAVLGSALLLGLLALDFLALYRYIVPSLAR